MQKKNDKLSISLLIIAGLLYFIKVFHIYPISGVAIFSVILIIYGFARSYQTFGKREKSTLFLHTALFLFGILLFVNSVFILKGTATILLPSIFFITASGFAILFIEKPADRTFLYLSLMLFTLSMIFTYSERASVLSRRIMGGIYTVQDYWPFLLIIAGLYLFLRKPFGK